MFLVELGAIEPGTGLEGGVFQDSLERCSNTVFLYLSHSAVFICRESSHPVPNGRKRGGRERPPPKRGGHVTPIAALCSMPLSRPQGGRYRRYLSLREGSKKTPRSGVD